MVKKEHKRRLTGATQNGKSSISLFNTLHEIFVFDKHVEQHVTVFCIALRNMNILKSMKLLE